LQIAAAEDENGEPMVREVAILFENYLWRGNRSTKSSADNFNAFKSNNYPELARIGLDINFKREYLWRGKVEGKLKVKYPMDTNVMFLTPFPGISELVVRHVLSTPGIKGVVLKSFGAGNAPNEAWFLDVVRQAIERGVVVVNITQCTNGCVMPMRYVTGKELSDAGCVSGYDLTSEAAITKLMYLLGQGLSAEEVKRQMATSLCGEMTI
jgi:L-asparaginase